MALISIFHSTRIPSACIKFSQKNLSTKYFSSKTSENHYDVVIAGGGLVGTTLACTLGKNSKLSNRKILLLEASKERLWSIPKKYSNRVVSINPGTYKLMNDIDVWKHVKAIRYCTVKRLQVWDAVSDASITFGEESSTENVSYIVENDLLLGAVSEEVKNVDNVEVLYNAKVKSYHLPDFHENCVEIHLEDGSRYTCDLLNLKPTMWLRYVDDTFVIWIHRRDGLTRFLDHLNAQHPKIKFTKETEQDQQIAFLAVLINKMWHETHPQSVPKTNTHG